MTDKKPIFSPKQMVANYLASRGQGNPVKSVTTPRTLHTENEPRPHSKSTSNSYVQSAEDYWSLKNRNIKYEQIDEWTARIKDLNNQIEKIKSSNFLSEAEKQQKIARRVDIISFFQEKIVDTEIFLGIRCATNSKTR